jgi:hypothetical protein
VACVKKLSDALAVMDWDIKRRPNLTKEQEVIAEKQEAGLRSSYDKIENLKEACKRLALGEFYGYAHLNKVYAGGLKAPKEAEGKIGEPGYKPAEPGDPRYQAGSWDVVELRFVPQWFWSRKGFGGAWLYNPEARGGENQGSPIALRDWVIREVDPPLGDVLARAHHRMEMAEEDWADHDDTFAVPPTFIEGPPNASRDQEAEFQDIAERIVSNGRGFIPNGSKIHTVTVTDAGDSFKLRLGTWEAAIVLVVTRGKLTMLSEPQGIGAGASGEHGKGWDDVAAALALDVSECFQKQLDPQVLQRVTPGQPCYAYFEFARPAQEDVKAHCENASTLFTAGYVMDPEDLGEKTGYKLTAAPVAGASVPDGGTGRDPAPDANPTPPPAPVAKLNAPAAQAEALPSNSNPSERLPETASVAAPAAAVEKPVSSEAPISRPSRAGEASPEIVATALANYVGLEEKWLAPVKPLIEQVIAVLADESKELWEVEMILQHFHDELPGLLPKLDTDALAKALEEAGTPGALQGTLEALNVKRGKGAKK